MCFSPQNKSTACNLFTHFAYLFGQTDRYFDTIWWAHINYELWKKSRICMRSVWSSSGLKYWRIGKVHYEWCNKTTIMITETLCSLTFDMIVWHECALNLCFVVILETYKFYIWFAPFGLHLHFSKIKYASVYENSSNSERDLIEIVRFGNHVWFALVSNSTVFTAE